MSGSVNKAIIVGNLGRDPEIRSMRSGDRVANLSIATSENWKDKNSGEKREKTEWHRVCVFNQGLINVIEQHLTKGCKVYIEGKLETRKWTDQSGVEKYSTEITVKPFGGELTILTFKDNAQGDNSPPPNNPSPEQQAAPASSMDMDEEIPF